MTCKVVSSAGNLTDPQTESSIVSPETKGNFQGATLKIVPLQGGELVVDSRDVAAALEIQHANLLETVETHKATIEGEFGNLRFETGTSQNSIGATHRTRFAYLTENQAAFVATLSRNSADSKPLKNI